MHTNSGSRKRMTKPMQVLQKSSGTLGDSEMGTIDKFNVHHKQKSPNMVNQRRNLVMISSQARSLGREGSPKIQNSGEIKSG